MLKVYLSFPFLTAKGYKDCYMQFVYSKVVVSVEVCVDASIISQVLGDSFERLHGVCRVYFQQME